MKKLAAITEVDGEGLISLLGERVTFFCGVYIYTGVLIGVNDTYAKLEQALVVFETGPFSDKQWKDAQALPHPIYVMLQNVEAFMILK